MIWNLLCDADCQLTCFSMDPTVPDPDCPQKVGLQQYTGKCVEKIMLNKDVRRVCT